MCLVTILTALKEALKSFRVMMCLYNVASGMIVRINCDCVGGQIDMIQLSKRVYNGLCLLFGSVV